MKIRALVVRVGKEPVLEDVGTDLDATQKLVGGWVEMVRCGRGVVLWCNEEAVLSRLPENRIVIGDAGAICIHGDFFFTGIEEAGDGELLSLTEDDALELCRRMAKLGPKLSDQIAAWNESNVLRIPDLPDSDDKDGQ